MNDETSTSTMTEPLGRSLLTTPTGSLRAADNGNSTVLVDAREVWYESGSETPPGKVDSESTLDQLQELSTEIREAPTSVKLRVLGAFRSHADDRFEDGMSSEFSREIESLTARFGNDAVQVISHLIAYQAIPTEPAAECLRWIGQIHHAASYLERRWLLEFSLCSPQPAIRDGASLGLAFLNDPHAIPYLRNAVQREKIASLKHDMEAIINSLEA